MSATQVQFERRVGQRFELHVPITVEADDRTEAGTGFTQNLSSKGALFQTSFALAEQEPVKLTLVMPSEITLGENMRVRCQGRVLRVVPTGSGWIVAVHFAGYEFLPEQEDNLGVRTHPQPQNEQPDSTLSLHTFSLRPSLRLE
jgi:hypothetical protein